MVRKEKSPKNITRREVLKYALYGGLAVGTGAAIWRYMGRDYAGSVRHVIMISIDTLRVDHLGCYGNEWIQTPNIDALADESILFTDFMTVATTTLASHVSLMTGKYPHNHGVPRNGFVVNPKNVMLAEILKDAGFHTAGFLGSFALDERFGFAQGFDYFNQEFSIYAEIEKFQQNERPAQDVTNAVIKYLDEGPLAENLFLFVHYFDPHFPYISRAPYDKMYSGMDVTNRIHEKDREALRELDIKQKTQIQKELPLYAEEVSYTDVHVGRLLDYLKKRNILDNAILIVTSDHGENLTDPRSELYNHGWKVYQPELHAVCMIRLPDAAQGGTKYESLTASTDILPTLTGYLGLPAPFGIDGEPLDLLNLRAPLEPPTRFAEGTKPHSKESDPRWFNMTKARCVRRGPFKYIQTLYKRTEELYDLRTDPGERDNLLSGPARRAGTVANDLRKAFRQWVATARPLPSHFDPSQKNDTIRRLKSLGYLK
jgi:arylsulfatase A-like enzyme